MLNEDKILEKATFAAVRVVQREMEAAEKRLDEKIKELDASQLRRTKEVRASLTVGTQQFKPEKARRLSGTGSPSRGLGENKDTYDEVAAGVITARWVKLDGQWSKIGDYSVATASAQNWVVAAAPAQAPYLTLDGLINSSNKVFTTPTAYTSGTLTLDWNGATLYVGSGITETDAAAGTVTMTTAAPSSGQLLRARYVPDV